MKHLPQTLVMLMLLMVVSACNKKEETTLPYELVDVESFDAEVEGKQVQLITLKNSNGMALQATNYGLRLVSLFVPDRDDNYADVAVGYESIDHYLNTTKERFVGPVVGRYANRIAKGYFEIDGVGYQLPINNNGQTLHGGLKGLDSRVWEVIQQDEQEVHFKYVSPDGEEGFPGTLTIEVIYRLTDQDEFCIEYTATTDKPTVVNLSSHAFYNLSGRSDASILDHELTISAHAITPVDEVLIPTGNLEPVVGTPFDFNEGKRIGQDIAADHEQLKMGLGYDHNFVLTRATESDVEHVATLYEPVSGRVMEILTDQPGLQFYSGNFFDGEESDKYGNPINYRSAMALETQKFPDGPNHPDFPDTRLNPGEVYTHKAVYRFSTR
ncbi:MAG: aldose epimerase family protein [Porphyromonas sp.]|nr:aldose epimerase family protein [Porphyromonas sp.]